MQKQKQTDAFHGHGLPPRRANKLFNHNLLPVGSSAHAIPAGKILNELSNSSNIFATSKRRSTCFSWRLPLQSSLSLSVAKQTIITVYKVQMQIQKTDLFFIEDLLDSSFSMFNAINNRIKIG